MEAGIQSDLSTSMILNIEQSSTCKKKKRCGELKRKNVKPYTYNLQSNKINTFISAGNSGDSWIVIWTQTTHRNGWLGLIISNLRCKNVINVGIAQHFSSLHTAFIACYKQPSSLPNSSHMVSESTMMMSPIIGLGKDKPPTLRKALYIKIQITPWKHKPQWYLK